MTETGFTQDFDEWTTAQTINFESTTIAAQFNLITAEHLDPEIIAQFPKEMQSRVMTMAENEQKARHQYLEREQKAEHETIQRRDKYQLEI